MAQSLIALRDTDLRHYLAAISAPTLIMHWKKDKNMYISNDRTNEIIFNKLIHYPI